MTIYPLSHSFSFSPEGCRMKIHKEHLEEEKVAPCKVNYDMNTAKELLLLAGTLEEQNYWVSNLRKKIAKCGYAANQDAKSSPRSTSSQISLVKHSSIKSATTSCIGKKP